MTANNNRIIVGENTCTLRTNYIKCLLSPSTLKLVKNLLFTKLYMVISKSMQDLMICLQELNLLIAKNMGLLMNKQLLKIKISQFVFIIFSRIG